MPNKEKVSYSIFFAMVKLELTRQGMELAAEKMLVDFEIAIQTAAIETWPQLLIQGCRYWCFAPLHCARFLCGFASLKLFHIILLHRFHWAQALQRWFAEAGMGPLAKRSVTFKSFFHACLGLCMLRETDLEGAMEELRNIEMEDEILEQAKDQFLR